MSKLASTAFLAFAAGTRTLQAQILRNSLAADEDMSAPLNHWQSLSDLPADDVLPAGSQMCPTTTESNTL